jgi:uncharacterized protein YfeS
MAHIITNMKESDMILVASHNQETIRIATNLLEDRQALRDSQSVVFG